MLCVKEQLNLYCFCPILFFVTFRFPEYLKSSIFQFINILSTPCKFLYKKVILRRVIRRTSWATKFNFSPNATFETSSLHCLVCYSEKWTPRVILLSPKPLVPLTSIASFIKRKDLFCTCKAGQEVSSIAGSWICWCLDSQCATNFKFNIPKKYKIDILSLSAWIRWKNIR